MAKLTLICGKARKADFMQQLYRGDKTKDKLLLDLVGYHAFEVDRYFGGRFETLEDVKAILEELSKYSSVHGNKIETLYIYGNFPADWKQELREILSKTYHIRNFVVTIQEDVTNVNMDSDYEFRVENYYHI